MENSGVGHRGGEVLDPLSEEMAEMVFTKKRGCCFWIPCLGSKNRSETDRLVWWGDRERIRRTSEGNNEDRWWTKGWKALKKAREWSEIIAGPKWKTFIRRFNKNNNSNNKSGKFQYDPLSYALNFDEGLGQNDLLDDDFAYRDFSSRYASSIPISAKSSMDLGKDGPSFV